MISHKPELIKSQTGSAGPEVPDQVIRVSASGFVRSARLTLRCDAQMVEIQSTSHNQKSALGALCVREYSLRTRTRACDACSLGERENARGADKSLKVPLG